jgi:hypothetical protein
MKKFPISGRLCARRYHHGLHQSSPARPSETGAAPAGEAVTSATVNGVTLTTPTVTSPTAGQKFASRSSRSPSPSTTASTSATALTLSFQVATDAGFTAIAYSKTQ